MVPFTDEPRRAGGRRRPAAEGRGERAPGAVLGRSGGMLKWGQGGGRGRTAKQGGPGCKRSAKGGQRDAARRMGGVRGGAWSAVARRAGWLRRGGFDRAKGSSSSAGAWARPGGPGGVGERAGQQGRRGGIVCCCCAVLRGAGRGPPPSAVPWYSSELTASPLGGKKRGENGSCKTCRLGGRTGQRKTGGAQRGTGGRGRARRAHGSRRRRGGAAHALPTAGVCAGLCAAVYTGKGRAAALPCARAAGQRKHQGVR
jgi:hypothetical protein